MKTIRDLVITNWRNHKYLLNSIILAFLFVSSCEAILEELIDDCNSYNYPIIKSKDLQVGYRNQFYSDFVKAEVKNDPHDDDYDYYFEVSSELPNGIDWSVAGRKLILEGTPAEVGVFIFKVELWVEVPQEWYNLGTEPEQLCTDYTSKEFVIDIKQ